MRASRLVSCLLLLQTRGRMTAQQLADTLEVSVRTIYRDIDSLSAAGVPVYGNAGPAGGYQLLGGYRTRLNGLTFAEAEALSLAGIPAAAAELGLGTVLAAAQLKLQAALPTELRDRAAAIGERFHLDAPGWYHDGDSSPHLAAVASAVWNQRRIEIRYRRWVAPEEVLRTVEPHGIVLKAGKWYAVALTGGTMRTYRIAQILDLTMLPETFDRLDGFSLTEFWGSSIIRFRAGLQQGEATIRLSQAGRQRMHELLNSAVIDAAEATAGEPDERGWITAVVPIESLQHAQAEFLRLGADVEIIEPIGLRDRMASIAGSLALLYSPGPSGVLPRPVRLP